MCLVLFGPIANSSLNPCVHGPSLVFVQPALACIGLRWPLLAVVGHLWPFFGLWGSKRVVWISKCMAGVLRRVAECWNTWLWVGRCTIGKNIKKYTKNKQKNTPMAQTMRDASFGPVVVVATPQSLLVLWKT
jgi:hypothetical protein